MAYRDKYIFRFESIYGIEYKIHLRQDGYSGPAIYRALGAPPKLKKKKNGRIYGTSLEFDAECKVDGEFAELYTSDPYEYSVLVYRTPAGDHPYIIWQGFVDPELYSEPDIAPPYDVHIVASDGFGELKEHMFVPTGMNSIVGHLTALMAHTGLGFQFPLFVSKLSGVNESGSTVSPQVFLNGVTINLDFLEGKTCYDVLQYILTTLQACITQYRQKWLIYRENDIEVEAGAIERIGGDIPDAAIALTTLGNGLAPEGYLTTSIEPAKREVSILAPYHRWTKLVNPDMRSDSGWTKHDSVAYSAEKQGYLFGQSGYLSQSIANFAATVNLEFALKMGDIPIGTYGVLWVRFTALKTGGGGSGWTFGLGYNEDGELVWGLPAEPAEGSGAPEGVPVVDTNLRLDAAGLGEVVTGSFAAPAFDIEGYETTGTMEVQVRGAQGAVAYGCYIYRGISKGVREHVVISNGARSVDDEEEIAHGYILSGMSNYFGYLRGVFVYSGSHMVSFSDNVASNQDFLNLVALNRAHSVGDARALLSGMLDTDPTGGWAYLPLILTKGGVELLIETYTWDFYNESLDFTARSLPAVSVTVEESSIVDITGSSAPGGSGPSGGGGGGVSPSVVDALATQVNNLTSRVEKQEALIGEDANTHDVYVKPYNNNARDFINEGGGTFRDLTLPAKNIPSAASAGIMLEAVSEGGQTYIHTPFSICADGAVSAGGLNPNSEGGGASSLNELDDVVISSPSSGQLLKYNGTNWVNDTDSGGEMNVIETVKLNGTALPVEDKAVNVMALTNHQSLGLVAAKSSGVANATTANNNTYINLVGGGTFAAGVKLTGSTNISVSATGGVITITGPSLTGYLPLSAGSGNALTGDLYFTGNDKRIYAQAGFGVSVYNNNAYGDAFVFGASENSSYKDLCPSGSGLNLGSSSAQWNNLYAKRWYPDVTNAPGVYIECDSSDGSVVVHGNIVATGAMTSGSENSGEGSIFEVSSAQLVEVLDGDYGSSYNVGIPGLAAIVPDLKLGLMYFFKCGPYTMLITQASGSSGSYVLYMGRYRFDQTSSDNWTINLL